MLIGAVADDITGATDLCLMLSREGLRTAQTIGIPDHAFPEADAIVIALKSRSIPADQAISLSVQAAQHLRAAGAAGRRADDCLPFDSSGMSPQLQGAPVRE